MEGLITDKKERYEWSEQKAQDIKFIRSFLHQMDQTRVLRWRNNEEAKFTSSHEVKEMKESDAEHTGQMNTLGTLVILKARLEGDQSFEGGVFDVLKMNAMISLHDIEENIVGDERFKDKQYYRTEQKALDTVAEGVSDLNIGSEIVSLINEYKSKASPEARFVKAIDELQAWFYMVYTKRFDKSTRDFNQPEEIKGYLLMQEFPVLKRIADILLNILQHPQRYSDKIVDLDLIRQQYESH